MTTLKIKEVKEQISKAHGNLSTVARTFNVSRTTLYKFLARHPEIKEVITDEREKMIDNVESTLYNQALDGNTAAMIFFLKTQAKSRGYIEGPESPSNDHESVPISLPAELIASNFLDAYRGILSGEFTEFDFDGGRGSLKSTFVSEASTLLLVNNPNMHMLVLRQVKDTLRASVYSQLKWAIEQLGLIEKFKFTTSPLEITYKPTGQKIYFRGADDPTNIKSIKPPFGYIGILWFEEFDQFRGEEPIRSIIQSALRGGNKAYWFNTWNTPKSRNHWVNKYIAAPKPGRYHLTSNYLSVPKEWLGSIFINEAEHLKSVNPKAYEHEYLGIANGTGGTIFDNLELRTISDEEIQEFEHIYYGLDWGYALDPLHWVKLHYDAGKEIIYVFDEFRAHKLKNKPLYDKLVKKGMTPKDLLIADSAEPKSIADLREYGLNVIGTEKGPDSVRYGMRWLENRAKIVVDNQRCPFLAEEMLNYEFEQTKDGQYISEYPDRNNHGIDALRYALNMIWRQRGK